MNVNGNIIWLTMVMISPVHKILVAGEKTLMDTDIPDHLVRMIYEPAIYIVHRVVPQ